MVGFESKASLRRHRRAVHGFVVCDCRRKFLKSEYMAQHRAMSRVHKGFSNQFAASSSLIRSFQGLAIASTPDLYSLQRDEVDTFISNYIQVDSPFRYCCGEVIDTLVRKLHQIVEFAAKLEPREIIKVRKL
jgi:hypothetical protein